jgi:hypothetical protein
MDTSELSSLFTMSELVQMAMTPEVAKTYYAVRRVTWHPPQDPDEFVESVLQVLRRHPEQLTEIAGRWHRRVVKRRPRPASLAGTGGDETGKKDDSEALIRRARGVPAEVAVVDDIMDYLDLLNIDSARKERVLTMAKVVADIPESQRVPVLQELCRRRYEEELEWDRNMMMDILNARISADCRR